MSKKVYIAGPLSTGGEYSVICQNVAKAIDAADLVFQWGGFPFLPHLSHYWNIRYYHPWDEWMKLDRAFIVVCDIVWRLPGESRGADQEVQWANELDIPVIYSIAELREMLFFPV